jgi:hypothetical protein
MKAAGAAEYFWGLTNIIVANNMNAQQKYVATDEIPVIIFSTHSRTVLPLSAEQDFNHRH